MRPRRDVEMISLVAVRSVWIENSAARKKGLVNRGGDHVCAATSDL